MPMTTPAATQPINPRTRTRSQAGEEIGLSAGTIEGSRGGTLDEPEVLRAEGLGADVVGEGEEPSVHGDLGGMGSQGIEFAFEVLGSTYRGRHELILDRERDVVGIHLGESRRLPCRSQLLNALSDNAARERRPVDLGDVPGLTQIRTEGPRRCQRCRVHRDAVSLDVIGKAVSAEVVVRDEDLGTYLANHPHEVRGRLEQVAAPEGPLAVIRARAGHTRVAVAPRCAQEAPVSDTEDPHRFSEFALAMLAEPILPVRGEVLKARDQDLALLAEGARHEGDAHASIDVPGHHGPGADGLVIWMGVHEEDAPVGHAHRVVRHRRSLRQDMRVTQPRSDETYPRQRARTRGFRLGAPRSFTIDTERQRVFFLRSHGGSDPVTCLWSLDLTTGKEACVVDPSDLLQDAESLPPEERARRERMREVSAGITDYATDRDRSVAVFALSGAPYASSLDTDQPARMLAAPGPVIDPRPDPTGTHVAYVSDRSLWVAPLEGGPARVVCASDADEITWGLADFIAAEEFDRVRGYWWLADGTGLLVERVDDSPVEQWWIADPAHPDQPARAHRYPAAGRANADVSLWLVPIDGGPRVEIEWDHADLPYLARVAVPETGHPLVTLLSRDQRRQVILEVDPATGAARMVRERTDPEWVELMPGVPTRTPLGGLVEIVADRSADTYRLVVDDIPLSPQGLQVESLVDAGDDDALVVAATDPTYPHLVRIGYDGSIESVLGRDDAVIHGVRAGSITLTSTMRMKSTATEVDVWQGGSRIAGIASMAEKPIIEPRVHLIRGGDPGLDVAVLFPSSHVPGSRRLPVIMSPYGGPHARRVIAAGLAYGTDQWLADQGYCVIVADGRGTPGRGPAWDRAVRGDLATPALEDQVAALEAVAVAYPDDVDVTRVGIRGWSFGGYLAALAVLRRPDVFHAAVAGAPVTEWRLYDTGYTERYLGLPQEDPDAYERSSLLPLAAGLTRPLLIIHGLADDNVVVAHTLQLSSALLASGKPHAVLPLTGVTHMTPQEVVAENLLRAEVDFFDQALRTD